MTWRKRVRMRSLSGSSSVVQMPWNRKISSDVVWSLALCDEVPARTGRWVGNAGRCGSCRQAVQKIDNHPHFRPRSAPLYAELITTTEPQVTIRPWVKVHQNTHYKQRYILCRLGFVRLSQTMSTIHIRLILNNHYNYCAHLQHLELRTPLFQLIRYPTKVKQLIQ